MAADEEGLVDCEKHISSARVKLHNRDFQRTRRVDGGGRELLAGGDALSGGGLSGALSGNVGTASAKARSAPTWARRERQGDAQRDLAGLGLTRDKALPRLVALVDDLGRVLAVLGLAGEGELGREREGSAPCQLLRPTAQAPQGPYLVLGLSVRDLITTRR